MDRQIIILLIILNLIIIFIVSLYFGLKNRLKMESFYFGSRQNVSESSQFNKKILICDLPNNWKEYAGFFSYPLMYINCILYCKLRRNEFYDIPLVDFDDNSNLEKNSKNKYLDNKGIFWNNYFISTNIDQKYLNLEKVRLTNEEYDNIHHNFGIQTYPYGLGMYKNLKEKYDKPYTAKIKDFYFKNRVIANEIINKHIKINMNIISKVNKIIANLPKYEYLIGVHIRGTDKKSSIGGRKIEPKEYFVFIDNIMKKNKNSLIFLATDDSKYHNIFNKKYKEKVTGQNGVLRSKENIFLENLENNYKKGEDVLIDCLCLSKCNFLIHQSSSVSEFAIYFNINLHNNSLNLQYDNSKFLQS